jgi:cytochrome c oxidase subunit II
MTFRSPDHPITRSPDSSKFSAVPILLSLLFITAATVYLFAAHPWWFPAGVSTHAAAIDHQFMVALWLLGGLFIAGQLVLGLLLLRSRFTRQTGHAHGSWPLEITWTILIACLFFWFNITGNRLWSEIKLHHPEADALQVEVTGTQFQWYFRYPGSDGKFGRTDAQRFAKPEEGNPLGLDPGDPDGKDDIVSTAMVLPVGHDVDLTLRANDVIHGLFIPAMRFKQDTVPGMNTHAHFKPMQIGTYEIVCSQLCGVGHYRMRASARIVSDQEFNQWLKAQSSLREASSSK